MSAQLASGIFEGWIAHRRSAPVPHAFRYRMFMMYLDLAELDRVFESRWWWSAGGSRRPASFRREDHFGDPSIPLDTVVRDTVAREAGSRPEGPIRLLTHLRYFGHIFNPVSFYYCFDRDGTTLRAVVADVSNTPWGERHQYVLPVASGAGTDGPVIDHRFALRKQFHVSPFMPMEIDYEWTFRVPGKSVFVHMVNRDLTHTLFDATLSLRRREITGGALARVLAAYPAMTARVVAAIYWQAFRLWLKRCPFYTHPRTRAQGSDA